MVFDKFKNKISEAVSGRGEKVEQGIDKAKDFVDEKTGGQYGDKLDSGAEKAKGYVDQFDQGAEGETGENAGESATGSQEDTTGESGGDDTRPR